MKTCILGAMGLLYSAAALAGPTISDACLRAVEIERGADAIEATAIQEFPDLTPPRTQLEIRYSKTAKPDGIAAALGAQPSTQTSTLTVRCSFDGSTSPVGLTDISCPDLDCFIGEERVEEIRMMLEREGF